MTQLQSKRIVTAKDIAEKHNISIRTVYRDIRTLEKSGVPIVTEEGKLFNRATYSKTTAKGDLMQGLVVRQWAKIFEMELDRTYDADFEIFGEKAQNPAGAEVEFYVGIKG